MAPPTPPFWPTEERSSVEVVEGMLAFEIHQQLLDALPHRGDLLAHLLGHAHRHFHVLFQGAQRHPADGIDNHVAGRALVGDGDRASIAGLEPIGADRAEQPVERIEIPEDLEAMLRQVLQSSKHRVR